MSRSWRLIGWVPVAVTTNLNINFLNKPAPRDLIAEARLIKRRQAACGRRNRHPLRGEDELVAHATGNLFDARQVHIIPQPKLI